ncbi:MAG TPA: hypothetical protein VFJ58_06765 [Armatimonadota bacterium]|nr:hypothetical protein [Armatimonadota bacterium]
MNWSGDLTQLHLPEDPGAADEVFPWIDGKSLVIDEHITHKLQIVDGATGKVTRSISELIEAPHS